MKMKITSIAEKGDIQNERVGLIATADCNTKFYLLFKTYFNKAGFFNSSLHTYWFPPTDVKANDKIVVYTRSGNYSVKQEQGITIHFFYWGKSEPLYTDVEDGVVLAEIDSWQLSRNM